VLSESDLAVAVNGPRHLTGRLRDATRRTVLA
jgi:hypothetical protein